MLVLSMSVLSFRLIVSLIVAVEITGSVLILSYCSMGEESTVKRLKVQPFLVKVIVVMRAIWYKALAHKELSLKSLNRTYIDTVARVPYF